MLCYAVLCYASSSGSRNAETHEIDGATNEGSFSARERETTRHTEGAMIGRAESMETGIATVFLATWKPF